MPVHLILLFFRLLGVFESLEDLLLLLKTGLLVDIVGVPHLFIADNVLRILHFEEELSRVLVRVLVRMVLNARPAEGFFELRRLDTSGGNIKQLIIVLWLLYTRAQND